MPLPVHRLRARRKRWWSAVAAATLAFMAAGCGGTAGPSESATTPARTAAPAGAPMNANPIPQPEKTGWHGAVLTEPLAKPSFTLTDTAGQPYDFRAQTTDKVTLLFFGYTHCPDICPMHMANIATAMKRTGLSTEQVEVVFVTADPARDTPERLRTWLDHFNPGFVGLTGKASEITEIVTSLGLPPPTTYDAKGQGSYLVGHPAQVIAFTPDNQAHLVYPFGVGAPAFVADLPRLVNEGFTR
jgi:protein SCO1/2